MDDLGEERDPLDALAEEFLDRRRRGEDPSVADYLARCPGRGDELRDLLSVLEVVEGLRPSSNATRSHPGRGGEVASGRTLDRLGDYRILGEVGRGGMGVVYEAEQESLGRRVALKVLAPWSRADPRQVQRFLREARSAAQLHHPDIVPIFGVGEQDGLHYYAMQFIRGFGLDRVLDEVRYRHDRPPVARGHAGDSATERIPAPAGSPSATTPPSRGRDGDSGPGRPGDDGAPIPMPGYSDGPASGGPGDRYLDAVARIGTHVAEAIQYAHDRGMLHRDIKPSNLLLDGRGKVWVTDFGLVKAAGTDDLTETGDLVGTLRYMAPERFRGRCDARSDVYALGLTLYEMIGLRPAFEAADRHRLIHQITQSEPRPLRRLVPHLPRDLETVIHTAIARDPADRYPTAGHLAADLDRWRAHEPIRARPVSPQERLIKWARRNPAVASLAAVSVLTLLALVAALAIGYVEVDGALRREQRISYFQRIALAERAWSGNDVGRAGELLDDTPRGSRGWEWHYLKRLCHAGRLALRGPGGPRPNAVAFGPDGATLATADGDGRVALRDARSGRPIRTLDGPAGGVYDLAFSPDGRSVASAGGDGAVRLWDAATGRALLASPPRHAREALAVAFSPDGRRLASCAGAFWEAVARDDRGPGGGLALWDVATGRPIRRLVGHDGSVHDVAFAPDGRRLASAGGDGTVRVWDAETGAVVSRLAGHEDVVKGVAYSPDGRRLASAGLDGTLRLWDAGSGALLLSVREAGERFLAVAFSPDGRRLAAAGRSWAVTTWDAAGGRRLETYRGHDREVMRVAFSPDGRRLASAGFDGMVRVWDATRSQEALTLRASSGAVTAVAIDRDGTRLASADEAGPARVWDAATGRESAAPEAGAASPHGPLAFSPDGTRLAAGGHRSGRVEVRDPRTGRTLRAFDTAAARVTAVAFSPDGRLLAAGAVDGTVRAWDLATGGARSYPIGSPLPVTALAFRPDGAQLAASAGDVARIATPGSVTAWDLGSGRVALALRDHARGVSDLAYSPDGAQLAASGWDGTVGLWDLASGRPVRTLANHGLLVWAVAFTPDGRRVVAADNIGRITFWDTESGLEVLTLRGHPDRIYDLAFSADGRLLASASRDGTAKVWDATPLPHDGSAR